MIEVHVIPALIDNYIYVIRAPKTGQIAAIDPSEASFVMNFLQEKKWEKLNFIYNTHHHFDHVGGNLELKSRYNCEIYCSEFDKPRVPGATHGLNDNQQIKLGDNSIETINVPGHTLGAVCYYAKASGVIFTGDTLFTSGCGRLFEGTASDLWQSLKRLSKLPLETKVYSGHEYGLQNAAFAKRMFPENPEIIARYEAFKEAHRTNIATVSTTIGQELQTNPFLRSQSLEEFISLRRAKDDFRLED
ncbi:MAG: hydroxyacylglutathione hydrolase [Bdellovibrionales bacterium RBG_16_40_8]|nr:MAG: hydroxyacylglutathione hydrolase [Bdellovibrionales bacterium RBG_16_40_8]